MVVRLERGADLHMAQLMPLPLTVSCFSKIQIGFTFLVPARAILVIFYCLYHCIIVSFIQQFSPSRLQVCSINSVQFSSDPGSPGQRAVKRYACVCGVCVCAYDTIRGYILTCAQKLSAHFILLITLSLNERQRLFNNCDHKIEWLDIRINVTKSRCVCFGPLRYLYSNNHLWWSDICFG